MVDFLAESDETLCACSQQELDQFIYRIVHDLRASVRAIAELPSWIEEDLLEAGVTLPEAPQESFELLKSQASKLNRMLDILASRGTHHDPSKQPIDLKVCLQSVMSCLDSTVKLKMRTRFSPAIMPLNQGVVQSIFLIVLKNALQHSETPLKLALLAQVRGDTWELAIRDSCGGLKPAHLRPASNSEASFNKKGRGLFLLYDLVTRYGGTLELLAPKRLGQGATIFVRLPLEKASAA